MSSVPTTPTLPSPQAPAAHHAAPLPGIFGAVDRLLSGPTGQVFVGLFVWVVLVQVWLKPEADAQRVMYRELVAEIRLMREELSRITVPAAPAAATPAASAEGSKR